MSHFVILLIDVNGDSGNAPPNPPRQDRRVREFDVNGAFEVSTPPVVFCL
jgi:hypothetical protein